MPNPEANTPGPAQAPPDGPVRWAARLARRGAALAGERAARSLRHGAAEARRRAGWLWARRPPAVRGVAIVWSALAVALGAWSLLAQARLPARLPSRLDWAAASELVERDARPGDAVALSPAWAERAREVLPASIPVLTQARYAGEDLVGVRRVWLLSLQRAPGFSYLIDGDLAERASQWETLARLGGLEATRYDLSFPTLPLAFLPDRLAHAEVSLGGAPCTREPSGAFVCAGPPPARVERAVHAIAGAPRPCIVVTLGAPANEPLVLAFPAVRVGRIVRGHLAPLPPTPSPVRIDVRIDGEEAGSADLADPSRPFRIDTSRFAARTGTVSLAVTGPGGATLCLDATVLP